MKRLLSMLLVLSMALAMLPMTAWAATEVASGTCGENLTWVLDDEGTLTISGTGAMDDYFTYDPAPWYSVKSEIKSVIIENGVTTIGDQAFYHCENCAAVWMADSVTRIGGFAFAGCSSLVNVIVSQNLEYTEACTFLDCTSLEQIQLPASQKQIGIEEFIGCTNLKTIEIDPDNQYLISVDGVVYNKAMTTIWGSAPGVDLGDFVVPDGVTYIDMCAFSGNPNLTSLTLPEGLETVATGAFRDCTNLQSVVLPASLTILEASVFKGCISISSITIPNGIRSIYREAFSGCTKLKEIIFEGDAPGIVEEGEGVTGSFADVTATAYVPASNDTWTDEIMSADYGGDITWRPWGTAGEQIRWYIDHDGILNIFGISETSTYARSAQMACVMEDYENPEDAPWYEYREEITAVAVDDTVAYIGTNAFVGCVNLTEATIGTGVVSIGTNAFADCPAIKTVTFEGDAPVMNDLGLGELDVTVKYPADNDTWTDEVVADIGENVTCVPYIPIENPFTDVKETDYYYDAVMWAVENGITAGYGTSGTIFAPDINCTRAQVVTFLWRAAGSPTPTSSENPFKDVSETDWYYTAVLWAAENGITAGYGAAGDQFRPDLDCTRGQVVTFLYRAAGEGDPTSDVNPFTDVGESNWYYEAVLWAVENGVTAGYGTSGMIFAPDVVCSRGQIVTFLYRAYN